jgi:EPS-associated MarR family transcriptional regulator
MSDPSSRRSQLQEDTYFRVLRLLQRNPDLTQRELAGHLGVSVSGLNYCLKALIDKGLVKMQNFSTSKNKFGYVYLLTPHGIAEKARLTGRFLQRKLDEYEALKNEIDDLKRDRVLSELPRREPEVSALYNQLQSASPKLSSAETSETAKS